MNFKQTIIPFMHMICTTSSSNTMSSAAFIHQSKYMNTRLSYHSIRSLSVSKLQSNNNDSSVCDVSDNINIPDLVNTKGSATILRNYNKLKNVNGKDIKLGDCMGTDTSIVVFLRHLA